MVIHDLEIQSLVIIVPPSREEPTEEDEDGKVDK